MKYIYTLFTALLIGTNCLAQDILGQIALFPVILNEDMPSDAIRVLSNAMSRIVAENGFGSVSHSDRFILSSNIDVISNSVVPSNPPRVSKSISVTFVVGDIVENRSFASCSIDLNGIGVNDTKAFIAALSRLSPSNPEIKSMILRSKSAIIDYYGQSTGAFIANAKALAMKGNYDEAIAYLMSFPPVNEQCFVECQAYATELYVEKRDKENYSLLSSAQALWTVDKTKEGALQACNYLKQISSEASCFTDALSLWEEISNKLAADEIAAEELAMKQYNDQISLQKQKSENARAATMAIIDACKAIGTAFGENRPQNVQRNIIRGWFFD